MAIFDFFKPSIAKINESKDEKYLIKALGYTKDVNIRQHAAKKMSEIGSSNFIKPLEECLFSWEDDILREAASSALINIYSQTEDISLLQHGYENTPYEQINKEIKKYLCQVVENHTNLKTLIKLLDKYDDEEILKNITNALAKCIGSDGDIDEDILISLYKNDKCDEIKPIILNKIKTLPLDNILLISFLLAHETDENNINNLATLLVDKFQEIHFMRDFDTVMSILGNLKGVNDNANAATIWQLLDPIAVNWYGHDLQPYLFSMDKERLAVMKKMGVDFKRMASIGKDELAPLTHIMLRPFGNHQRSEIKWVLKYLFSQGISVNATDHPHGNTLLHKTAGPGDSEMTKFLLECGANKSLRNGFGTPLELAKHNQSFSKNAVHQPGCGEYDQVIYLLK